VTSIKHHCLERQVWVSRTGHWTGRKRRIGQPCIKNWNLDWTSL